MTTAVERQQPSWKAALTMMFNPGLVVKQAMTRIPWPFSLPLSVSCLAPRPTFEPNEQGSFNFLHYALTFDTLKTTMDEWLVGPLNDSVR